MPRRYAPLLTSIWDNDGFRSLSPNAQRMYLQVLSQKRLSLCGVVPYQPRNWARGCSDITEADIERDITELVERDYVWVDRQTEELVVRTMIKHDPPRGSRSIAGMWNDWREIDSIEIRKRVVHSLPAEIWDHKAVAPPDEAKPLRNAPCDEASKSRHPQENEHGAAYSHLPPSSSHLPPSSVTPSCEDPGGRTDDERIEAVVKAIVDHRILMFPAKGNAITYRETVERSVRDERTDRIRELTEMCAPDTPVSVIAGAAESGDTRQLAPWLRSNCGTPPVDIGPTLSREERDALIAKAKETQ